MSDRPGKYEMSEALDFMSEHPTTLRILQALETMTSELGDEAEMLRTVKHWLEWKREQ